MLYHYIRFEVFTPVAMKNAIFWDVISVAPVRINILEEHIATIIRVTRIGELGTTLGVTNNKRLQRNASIHSN
jgi:hypothetical protein